MKIPPSGDQREPQEIEVLGDGGLGEGPSFKKGLPPKKHFLEKISRLISDSSGLGDAQSFAYQ
jgi:hypothetical protein